MFRLVFKYTTDHRREAVLTPVFVILEVILDVLIPYVMSLIIDKGVNNPAGSDIGYIYRMGAIMVGLSVLAMICGAIAGRLTAIASASFIRNVRMAMFRKVQSYSFANIEKFEVPSLVTRMTKDMREMRMAYVAIIRQLFRAPLNLFFSGLMVYLINRKLSTVFFVALPILAVGLYLIAHTAHPRFRALFTRFDAMNGSLEENFIAIRVVKTFVREQYEKLKFAATSDNVTSFQRRAEKIVILNGPLFNLVTYCCMIAISWFGGNMIIRGEMTTGHFMSYLSYMRNILFSLMFLSSTLMQIIFAQAAVDRANEVLNEKIDITDEGCDPDLQVADGSIDFNNVSFCYDAEKQKKALADISLHIDSGEMVGIIGSTGSGKTSLVQLIPRLYDVSEGSLTVGGHDVREYSLYNLRQAVAMVLQKNTLFTGTIEENLKWGNKDATREQVIEACQCAQAHDFISSFPDGYQTDLGQGGVNVSGGQKQRLCIARALLKKPRIIIMDDSTSAVDTDTDKRIRQALRERLKGMTTIIIAQRIASVMDADKIVVIDEGRIADCGRHEELMERNQIYSDLFYTQQKGVAE